MQVEAAFDFDEDNALEITYIARTDRTTPVNMACNLLLNLGGEGSGRYSTTSCGSMLRLFWKRTIV